MDYYKGKPCSFDEKMVYQIGEKADILHLLDDYRKSLGYDSSLECPTMEEIVELICALTARVSENFFNKHKIVHNEVGLSAIANVILVYFYRKWDEIKDAIPAYERIKEAFVYAVSSIYPYLHKIKSASFGTIDNVDTEALVDTLENLMSYGHLSGDYAFGIEVMLYSALDTQKLNQLELEEEEPKEIENERQQKQNEQDEQDWNEFFGEG